MNSEKIENGIREAFESVTPDIKAELIDDIKKEKGRGKIVKLPTEKKNKNRIAGRIAAIAAALVLLIGATFAVGAIVKRPDKAAATVMIDVNPSVELTLDKSNKVIAASAGNDDGAAVLSEMDLTGSDVKVAVNAVIGAMVRRGYLNEYANSVLISVESGDPEFGTRLRDTLGVDVREIMGENEFGYAVLCQTMEPGSSFDTMAEKYGISRSKAQLISRLVVSHPGYSFEELAALSINELGLLSGSNAVSKLRTFGSSSELAFIGAEQALNIALEDAGVPASEALNTGVELDCEHGVMVYEVEFTHSGLEYDYEIDAVTGSVIKRECEPSDDEPAAPGQTEQPGDPALISSQTALEIALDHAGVSEKDARDIEVELDRGDGRLIYEVEFKHNGTEYDYEIDAVTGDVLKAETDGEDGHATPTPKPGSTAAPTAQPTQKPSEYIGKKAALEIALNDAGVSASQANDIEVELETKNGTKVYDVEFKAGGREYEYVINAKTGSIISRNSEPVDDDHDDPSPAPTLISREQAWQIALERAGLTMSQISDKDIELESDNGVQYYEIEFKCRGYEYEIRINAVSGAVMKFEKELDD